MRELYLECYSGISGDMTVAALLDLGVPGEYLMKELEKLHLDGYEIKISRTKKNQITATDFDVILKDEHKEEHGHEHAHTHVNDEDVKECHEQEHSHEHTHVHNSYREIKEFILASELSDRVKEMILKIFQVIAEAEAQVHGTAVDKVHFHEVGAVDSIVDISAAAICLDYLGFDSIVTSEIWEGKGHVWCQHGRIPVPAPAVLAIFSKSQIRLHLSGVQGEMVTPTGAGIVAALSGENQLPDSFVIEKIGIGAGKKDFPHANVLRAMILNTEKEKKAVHEHKHKYSHEQEHSYTHCHEEQEIEKKKTAVNETKEEMKNKDEQKGFHDVQTETVCVMETNVDDCSGEQLGYAREVLLKAGALDVCCMPLYMKKGRPAYLFQIICKPADEEALKTILFRETTSIGFRRYEEERQKLDREMISVTLLDGNTIRIKKCMHHEVTYYYPEYEDVRKTCEMRGEAFRMVYEEARSLAKKSEE